MKTILMSVALLLCVNVIAQTQIKVEKQKNGSRVVTYKNGEKKVIPDSVIKQILEEKTIEFNLSSGASGNDTVKAPTMEVKIKRDADGKLVIDTAALKKSKEEYNEKVEQYLATFLLDKPCPDFALKDLSGKLWTNQDLKGKVTLINTWNIHCGPCKKEMPVLNQLMEKYPGYQFLAISPDSPEEITKIVESVPFLFTQLPEGKEFLKQNKLTSYPIDLILDRKGIVRYIISGAEEKSHLRLKKILEELKEE